MTISISLLLLFGGTIVSLPDLGIDCCVSDIIDADQNPVVNQDYIKFFAWNQSGVNQVELKFGNDTQLEEFFGEPQTTYLDIYFHDIGGNGLEKWIQDNKDIFLSTTVTYLVLSISVDYQMFVLNKLQAIRNIELIANRTSELLIRIKDLFPDRSLDLEPIGHGFGAIIAASVAERVIRYNISYLPLTFAVLDPEIIDEQDPDVLKALHISKQTKIPQIHSSLSSLVYVLHTSTCSRIPVIPACNSSTTDTMGFTDLYPNGGGTQPGCLKNDSCCSRERAPKIFVESNASHIFNRTKFYASQCSNFSEFQNGACNLCGPGPCYEISIYFNGTVEGRLFLYTNSVPPYARGYDQTSP